MAVAEFLENVDLATLGWAVVPSVGQEEAEGGLRPGLSPVGLSPILGMWEGCGGVEVGLRGRAKQQVDAIVGLANKVLAGMMDTSFGMLKLLLPAQEAQVSGVSSAVDSTTVPATTASATTATTLNATTGSTPWNVIRPNFGLLRRESGFSIASITASLPQAITSRKPGSGGTILRMGSRWSWCLLHGLFQNQTVQMCMCLVMGRLRGEGMSESSWLVGQSSRMAKEMRRRE